MFRFKFYKYMEDIVVVDKRFEKIHENLELYQNYNFF